MRFHSHHRITAKLIAVSLSVFICVLITPTRIAATEIQGKLLIRDDVSPSHRAELQNKLRSITGFTDLGFDSDGVLRWGRVVSKTGSRSARELLTKAATGDAVIVLQDASGRGDVAFCRVVPARSVHKNLRDVRAFVMLIDFADFKEVTGDEEARAAFDVGWGFLHELEHVVDDSEDARNLNEVGECEDEINKMRLELDLPVRMTYFYSALPAKVNPEFNTRLVRLRFEKREGSRTHRYWLIWNAATVGGLQQGQTASLR